MPPGNLPTIVTPALLRSIRACPNLPSNTWYFIAGVTLSVLNRPDEIPEVLKCALEEVEGRGWQDSGEQEARRLSVARRMREGLVKSTAIIGLPKTINALTALKPATPVSLQDPPLSFSPTNRTVELHDVPASQILQRGQTYFDRVYGKISQRVMGQLDHCGTEDLGLVARLMYGYLLSNTAVLSAKESSFVLISGLIPQDVNPQLKGHLKGALNNGATVEEVRAVSDVTIEICRAAGMLKLPEGVPQGWGWRDEIAKL